RMRARSILGSRVSWRTASWRARDSSRPSDPGGLTFRSNASCALSLQPPLTALLLLFVDPAIEIASGGPRRPRRAGLGGSAAPWPPHGWGGESSRPECRRPVG